MGAQQSVSDLRAQGYTCVDMHVHTDVSPDAFSPIERCLEVARRKGIGLAITDHNEVRGALEAVEKARDVLVIPGVEVKSQRGIDILVYFHDPVGLEEYYRKIIEPKRGAHPLFTTLTEQEIIEGAATCGGVISVAHPFAPRLLGLGAVIETGVVAATILEQVSFVETTNSSMNVARNARALQWAHERTKKMTGGSDAHFARHIGGTVTCVRIESGEHFLDALLSRDALIIGKSAPEIISAGVFLIGQIKTLFRPGGTAQLGYFMKMSLDRTQRLGGSTLPLPFPS